MLAKQFRFHGYGSLKFLYNKGKVVRARFVNLKYISNPRREDSRLAVVVAKKVSKKAPVRNRIRRRLYEAVRLHWPMLKPGQDMIITVFDENIANISSTELNKIVVELLTKADLYK
ncbi:ribonuclease P protein component [Candidatus Nomurabacteria bacterium]|nr:ribonuclease P protein component [Candidatus Nomurabacteria bacterium]